MLGLLVIAILLVVIFNHAPISAAVNVSSPLSMPIQQQITYAKDTLTVDAVSSKVYDSTIDRNSPMPGMDDETGSNNAVEMNTEIAEGSLNIPIAVYDIEDQNIYPEPEPVTPLNGLINADKDYINNNNHHPVNFEVPHLSVIYD